VVINGKIYKCGIFERRMERNNQKYTEDGLPVITGQTISLMGRHMLSTDLSQSRA